jgi:MFS family permease
VERLRSLRPYAVVALLNLSEGMVGMLVPPYMDSLGFTPTAIGLLVSVYAVASLVSRLPAGAIYRGERARGLLNSGLIAVIIITVVHPLATDATSLLLVRAMNGLAYGLASTINLALFIDLLPPQANRHHAMGYFMGALGGSWALGQACAGFAGDWWGYGWGYVLAAAPAALALLFVDAPRKGAQARAAKAAASGGLGAALRALTAPGILPIALLGFFMAFILNLTSTFMPLYALAIGLGLAEIGVLRSAHSICNSITRPFSGGFIQRVGHTRIGVATLVLNTGLLILLPSTTSLLIMGLIMTCIGLVRGIGMVANTISLASDVDESRVSRGLASGIYYSARDLGAIFGPVLGGVVAGAVGIEAMFRLVPPVALAAYLIGVGFSMRRAARQAAPEAVLDQQPVQGR